MKFDDVLKQLNEVYARAIGTGISVRQNFPLIGTAPRSIGDLKSSTVALKNIPYLDVYTELDTNDQFHLKLPDGGLMLFQYRFDVHDVIYKHRLAYFPSPTLPSREEAPELYDRDDLYADIMLNKIVRFPVRFDFDPASYVASHHAHSHLTLGQFDNCRIPASHPVSPNTFFNFIVRNFYHQIYKRNLNALEKKVSYCRSASCITKFEKRNISIEIHA